MTDAGDANAQREPAPRGNGAAAAPAHPDAGKESDRDGKGGYLERRGDERVRDPAMTDEKIGARPSPIAHEEFRPVGHVRGDRADESGASDAPIRRRATECGADERVGDVVHPTRCAPTSRCVQGSRTFG